MTSINLTAEVARLLLAAILVVAAAGKLIDIRGSERNARELGVPGRLAWPVAIAIPPIEIALAVGLIVQSTSGAAAAATAVLLALFTAAIGANVARGRNVDCGCFGPLHSSKSGPATVIRNLLLVAVAIFVAAAPTGTLTWVSGLVAFGVAALGLQAALWLALLRRHGHALARIDELEHQGPKPGLAPGTAAPSFSLANTHGARTALGDLLEVGKPVLLAFVDARCGPCRALLPDLARWQRELAERFTVAVVASGDLHAVQAMVADSRLSMLVSPDGAVARDYETEATPSALVVDPDGRIASSLRYAAEGVAGLVEEMTTRLGAPIHA